jgi:hypothetical protein
MLRLRSPRVASRYIGQGAPILLHVDGFLDTGDIVELHGDHCYRHASVSGSLVKSRKSPITDAIVLAEVVLKGGADSPHLDALRREIINLCRGDLAPYKVPAVVHFVPALPVSPSGKLLRHA